MLSTWPRRVSSSRCRRAGRTTSFPCGTNATAAEGAAGFRAGAARQFPAPISTRPSSALGFFLSAHWASGAQRGVQCHGGANEVLEGLCINLVALTDVDGTPGIAFEAGVEEAFRVLQRGAFGEGHLHHALIGLPRANDSGVRPHRNPSPLPLLDHFGVSLLDEDADPGERLASPVQQLLNSRIYQLRGACHFFFVRAALPLLHVRGCFFHARCRFLHACCAHLLRAFASWSVWCHAISFHLGVSVSKRFGI